MALWMDRNSMRSDGSEIASFTFLSYEYDTDEEEQDEEQEEEQEENGSRRLEDDSEEEDIEKEEEQLDDYTLVNVSSLTIAGLYDDTHEPVWQPYESTFFLRFRRRQSIAPLLSSSTLEFIPCSTVEYGTDEWKDMGCDHSEAPATTQNPEEESSDERLPDGKYHGTDWDHNRVDPDKPDGGGWRMVQAILFNKDCLEDDTYLTVWENPTSEIGVTRDTDFFFCEHVEFHLNKQNGETSGNVVKYERVLFSSYVTFRWFTTDLDKFQDVMRITSPCPADKICVAVDGNVVCIEGDIDGQTRKEYIGNITTLEIVDDLRIN